MIRYPRLLRASSQPRVFAPLLGAVAVSFLFTGCNHKEKVAAAAVPTDPNMVTVSPAIASGVALGTPQWHDVEGTLSVTARIQTDARRVARVSSPVSGRILSLLAFEGETVRAGKVLATLHSTDLSQAQLSLVQARSEAGLAQAAARRAEQLLSADVIGRAELERRRAESLKAEAEVEAYRTQLRGLGMSNTQISSLESSHKLNADYPIVAPRGGAVLERKVSIGQVVQPADPAFTIADLSSVWVVANVPEEDAGRLWRGMEVEVRVPARPESEIKGQLSYVSPIVNPETRTVEVRMNLNNREGIYKPDELATMTFTGRRQRELTVPGAAVVREGNKDFVFVQAKPNTFALREVTLGTEFEDRRPVVSGVSEADRIVTDGAFHLNNQRKHNAITGGE